MGIRWTSGSMLHSQNLHPEISDTVLKQVPDILERPIVIMESYTQVNSLTMLGEVYGENHIPVMAALYLDLSPDGLSVEEIGISNAYTKTREDAPPSIKGTQSLLNTSKILYVDPNKNRTDTWLKDNRLQLPLLAKYGPINKISLFAKDVNGNYSVNSGKDESPLVIAMRKAEEEKQRRTDSTGKELTTGQQSYFSGSKIRDADGRLKVMYRGGNGDFTVFDRKKSSYSNLYGRGFYFTEDKTHAEQYGKARAFYLNITNPLTPGSKSITRKQLRAFLQEVADNEDYGIENYGYDATVDSILTELKGKDDFSALQDINTTCIGDLVAAVELFNEVNGTHFDGIVTPTETVTFASEQSKETSNQTPTNDPDIQHQKWGIGETEAEQQARKESVANLKAENRILWARAEYWKAQTQQTRERTVRQQDTDRLANELLRKFDSRADKNTVKEKIKELGAFPGVKRASSPAKSSARSSDPTELFQ